MKTLYYISYEPLTDRYINRYHLDFLCHKGISIVYYDISAIFKMDKALQGVDRDYVVKLYSYGDLQKRIGSSSAGRKAIICNLGTPAYANYKIYRLLTKLNTFLIYFDDGRLPSSDISALHFLIANFNTRLFRKVIQKYLFYLKRSYIKKFDLVFTCGNISKKIFVGYNRLDFNSQDYNYYLTIKDKKNLIPGRKFAVFIDQNIPDHPDFILGNKKQVDRDIYYSQINTFFRQIEVQLQIKVVIAAHPTSVWKENPFEGREIFFKKTGELLKDAEFSITCFSTAINYSLLFNKPIVFYTSEQIKKRAGYLHALSVQWSNIFSCSFYNLSTSIGNIEVKDPSLNEYERFKYDFILSKEVENKKNEDIIYTGLSSI